MIAAIGETIAGMATVAFIGSGRLGGTVARLSVAAGHTAVLSNSRGPDTLKDLVDELGPMAQAATPQDAAEAADLLVVAIPLKAYDRVPVQPAVGKAVIDADNYRPERDGHFTDLDSWYVTSSELLQQHLPRAFVVKGFNNIYYRHLLHLARPAGAPDRSYLPIAGDSTPAMTVVTRFLDSIGYGAVDYGPLAESWRQQPGEPVCDAYGPLLDERGRPAGEDRVRGLLAAATR
jgi:hypothetical protein